MLAFIMWHSRSGEVPDEQYQELLLRFHRALESHKPIGFKHSAVFESDRAPWMTEEEGVYEDWYVMNGSVTLDLLNDIAVTGGCEAHHDDVARMSGNEAVGFYRYRHGSEDIVSMKYALWLSKLRTVKHKDFVELLRPKVEENGGGLWTRQMGLSHAPEFCLLSPTKVDVPGEFTQVTVQRSLVWP